MKAKVACACLILAACALGAPAGAGAGDRPTIAREKPRGVRFGEGAIKPGLPSSEGARVAGKISSVRGGELWIGAKRFLLTPTTQVLSSDRRKLSQKALEKGKAVLIEAAPGRGGVLTAKQIQFMEDEEPEKEKFL